MAGSNAFGNVLQLLGSLLLFVLILVASVYVTKWLGSSNIVQPRTRNMALKESIRIGPNRYLQIVMIGEKYYAIGVSKDQITRIAELDGEELKFEAPEAKPPIDFKEYFLRY